LNGIGGGIEPGELPFDAMRREFREEAGLDIDSWKHYCTITDDKTWKVYFFYAFSKMEPKTMTDEEVVWYDYQYLPSDVLPNLHWLIPMALHFEEDGANNFYVRYE
jgi:8-oxo-dGTP diphosphatase